MALITQKCQACEGLVHPLTPEQVQELLVEVTGWQVEQNGKVLARTFPFKNYFHTMAFVNAVAWIAIQENHHPDLTVTFNRCVVALSTHAVQGLTKNDFILAAKIEALVVSH
ncbi:MAG: 4a-hydroxytetrahydrobiopterin dehydratase [Gammaproteobacteria bacterium]|nr:4a-hydroxytetrahydrobiopterin dehydratase [Gammaproteobacteria bacterium]